MSLILTLMLFEWPVFNYLRFSGSDASCSSVPSDTADALHTLAIWEDVDVEDAQQRIDDADAAYEKQLAESNIRMQIENTIKEIEEGNLTYREVFSDVYVCGDSLVAGLSYFGLINNNHLLARVNADLTNLEENLPTLKAAKPKILILHYGINSIDTQETHNRAFVKKYRQMIEEIKSGSPKTRIIISLLFPVDTTVAREKRFTCVDAFNELLKEMCREEDIEYLDNSSLEEQCRILTKGDGIHMQGAFYKQYWGKHIMREMRIYK